MKRALRGLAASLTVAVTVTASLAACGGKGGASPASQNEAKFDADPIALLPSAAVVVANLDARAMFASSGVGAQLAAIADRLVPYGQEAGFVASRDLDRVAVGLYSVQGADFAAILKGRFDEQKIALAVQNHRPNSPGSPLVASPYAGRTIFTVSNIGFTTLSAETAICGTEAAIRRALDRLQDKKVARDLPPWAQSTLDTPSAAFAVAADLSQQVIPQLNLGLVQLGWLQGIRNVRAVGNFRDPGVNVAATVTYADAPHASAAADGIRQVSAVLPLLGMLGVPQIRNPQVSTVDVDVQTQFGVDDQALRGLLASLSRYL